MRYELYGVTVNGGSSYSNFFGDYPSFKKAMNKVFWINSEAYPNFAILEKVRKASAPISISSGLTVDGVCTRTKSFVTGEDPIKNLDDAYWYWGP